MEKIQVLRYSESCVAIIGDTKPIKDILKSAGGRFNPRLINPITHAPLMGWVFSKARESALLSLLSGNGVKYDRVTPSNFNDQL